MAQLASSFKTVSGFVRSHRPLTDDQILGAAPSVFAEAPYASRSARYAYIPTSHIINGLRDEGFMPFMACQARCRSDDKLDFTKHMLRFRQQGQIDGETANEIILVNSHDGSSSYQMLAGCFRFVCHNGLICGDSLDDLRIRHSGNVLTDVIEGAYRIVDEFEQLDTSKALMQGIQLTPKQQNAFANAALSVRYAPEENIPIVTQQLNQPRRTEDQGADLWHTLNRIQENLIRGGLPGTNRNGKRMTTRKITSVTENVRLNRALWTLAEEMARLTRGH